MDHIIKLFIEDNELRMNCLSIRTWCTIGMITHRNGFPQRWCVAPVELHVGG